jgi:hypothetical protein
LTFTLATFTVTGTANPPAGGTVTCTPGTVAYDGSSACTASANAGYVFSAFSGDCTGSSCSLSNIQVTKAVVGNFTVVSQAIPTLSEWATWLLIALLGAFGMAVLRSQRH